MGNTTSQSQNNMNFFSSDPEAEQLLVVPVDNRQWGGAKAEIFCIKPGSSQLVKCGSNSQQDDLRDCKEGELQGSSDNYDFFRCNDISSDVARKCKPTVSLDPDLSIYNCPPLPGQQEASQWKFSIMTFNVQAYKSATVKSISKFIENSGADIICLQEDTVKREKLLTPSYAQVSKCRAEYLKHLGDHLANTILVKRNLLDKMDPNNPNARKDITEGCDVPRCATLIRIGGLTIANVHLCGGRFADKRWRELGDVKSRQLLKIYDKYQPDIIVGDFNGDRDYELALKRIAAKHTEFKKLTNEADRSKFMKYLRGVHDYLDNDGGYEAAFTEAEIGPTSSYGTNPDWIYYYKEDNRLGVLSSKAIDAIPHLSDHNAIIVNMVRFF